MKISNVIEDLQVMLKYHGDLEVGDTDGNWIDQIQIMCGTGSAYIELGTRNYCNLFDNSNDVEE